MVQRFWVYQRERFPLLSQGILIALISVCGVSFARLVRAAGQPAPLHSTVWLMVWTPQVAAAMLVALGGALGFFFQLRVADEFKDYADDLRYRPYRPVP